MPSAAQISPEDYALIASRPALLGALLFLSTPEQVHSLCQARKTHSLTSLGDQYQQRSLGF